LRAGLAAVARQQHAKGLDYVRRGKQAAIAGDELQKIRGQAFDLNFFEDRRHGALLLIGGEHRAAHQAAKVLGDIERLTETVQVDLDLRKRVLLERELEQSGSIAARHA